MTRTLLWTLLAIAVCVGTLPAQDGIRRAKIKKLDLDKMAPPHARRQDQEFR
jgi:hypothetical protein